MQNVKMAILHWMYYNELTAPFHPQHIKKYCRVKITLLVLFDYFRRMLTNKKKKSQIHQVSVLTIQLLEPSSVETIPGCSSCPAWMLASLIFNLSWQMFREMIKRAVEYKQNPSDFMDEVMQELEVSWPTTTPFFCVVKNTASCPVILYISSTIIWQKFLRCFQIYRWKHQSQVQCSVVLFEDELNTVVEILPPEKCATRWCCTSIYSTKGLIHTAFAKLSFMLFGDGASGQSVAFWKMSKKQICPRFGD